VSATKELDDLMASISDLDIIEVKSYRTDMSLETVKSVFYYSLMSLWISVQNSNLYTLFRVPLVMEFRKTIFQACKVMENSKGHGK